LVSRFDDEFTVFQSIPTPGLTFDVRDLNGVSAGNQFKVVVLTTADRDVRIALSQTTAHYFNAGAGDDDITGGVVHDTILGGSGADSLTGRAGDDALLGGSGDDALQGDAGGDTLLGGDGEDQLTGGAGDDTMAGEAGADDYVFRAGDGFDTIIGYDKGAGGDQIVVGGYTQAQVTITQEGADVRVRFSAADSILLLGATTAGVSGTLVFSVNLLGEPAPTP
jgi:Ca2+-binding RTX toxin-like protein